MGFLDELIASAKTMVGKAEQQTDRVVEISKLKYQSAQLSSELRGLYEKLGQAVYAMTNGEYDNKELVDSLAEEITEVKAALAVVDEKISQRMNRKICPVCGAQSVKEAAFCMKCGAALETADSNCGQDQCPCEEEAKEEPAAPEAPATEAEPACCCQEAPAPEGEPACCCQEAAAPEQEQTEE